MKLRGYDHVMYARSPKSHVTATAYQLHGLMGYCEMDNGGSSAFCREVYGKANQLWVYTFSSRKVQL